MGYDQQLHSSRLQNALSISDGANDVTRSKRPTGVSINGCELLSHAELQAAVSADYTLNWLVEVPHNVAPRPRAVVVPN